MALPGHLVDLFPFGEDLLLSPFMAIVGGHETDGRVKVMVVIPIHEMVHPSVGIFHGFEAKIRITRAILHGPESRLDEGIVVTDTRAGKALEDPKVFEESLESSVLHRPATVVVENNLAGVHSILRKGFPEEKD